jgi:hypothetical protein
MTTERPPIDVATQKALAALDQMADEWAMAIDLDHYMANHDPVLRSKVHALMKQAFVEGAYRCYLDAKEGKIPWMKIIQ